MSSFVSESKSLKSPPGLDSGQSPTNSGWGEGLYHDPRTSSSQSLTPSLPEYEEIERRILLVVYIHGFMGNDTSFQSFPAHVHRYLKLALYDSHVIHSKIYPKYKTYKTIDIARDNFSKWLEPLESPKTDVVLVGHSMGGLLAADIVLMPSTDQRYGYFKHRIVGAVNLDAPLLGMHPGIVVSGISSLFRKNESPKSPADASAFNPGSSISPSPDIVVSPSPVSSAVSEPPPYFPPPPAPVVNPAMTYDPNFNPALPNDVRIEERTWWGNIFHFVKKHSSEGLIDAATNHVMSHLEFGGTMFDLNRLKTRYDSVRRLEDVDDLKQLGDPHAPPKVRFIQYYTICNGYPKTPKEAKRHDSGQGGEPVQTGEKSATGSLTPRTSTEKPTFGLEGEKYEQKVEPISLSNSERSSLELLSPEPIPDELPGGSENSTTETCKSARLSNEGRDGPPDNMDSAAEKSTQDQAATTDLADAVATLHLGLPAIPELPPQPEPVNLEQYSDKDARRLAEKEGKRVQKVYAQAVKDREKAIRDREKIIEKRKKKLAQEAEKKAKEEKKRLQKEEAAAAKLAATSSSASITSKAVSLPLDNATNRKDSRGAEVITEEEEEKKEKKKKKAKERKFCNIAKLSQGQVDPKWVSVFMKDMDEVAAHTSLFFPGEHYEKLVGEVGETIADWVRADLSKRAIMAFQGVD